ncbi:MAG: hypothetical protein ACPIOQ_77125 [Promethearchaeia archaeon]
MPSVRRSSASSETKYRKSCEKKYLARVRASQRGQGSIARRGALLARPAAERHIPQEEGGDGETDAI